jgi:peptidyl-prolyl cis-trans isomerase SurA
MLITSKANSAILLDRIVAIVNKEVITWSELYRSMEFEATDEIRSMKEEDRLKFFKEKESIFLENLIDMTLQLQEATKSGITASDEDINKTIDGIKKKYSLSDEQFREAIQKEGYTVEQYKKKLAEQIVIGRLVDQEIKSKIVITEQEIDRYLEQNKDVFKDEGFHISHIFLKALPDKKEAEEKAFRIYNMLKSGENFSDIARQYSEDTSARSEGELGFIKKVDLSEDFLKVLSTMKIGDISEPFWSKSGIHIIKLNDKREFKSQQEIRDFVKKKMSEEKLDKQYKNWVKTLRERAYIEIKL